MKMPRLLQGHSMTPAGMLRPTQMGISLKADGQSTAQMTLDAESPAVGIGDWIQIWAPNGEMCVMYVKNIRTDYVTGLVQITAEHCFRLLETMIAFGEITPETMTGTEGATSVPIRTAITYLLGRQTETLFELDGCDFTTEQGWKFTNSDLYADLRNLTEAVQECQWEFDFSVFPWRVSLRAWPTASSMEMRKNRNLSSLRITLDRSEMYTRAYPMGKNNLHIDDVNGGVPYLERNTATWGVISQVIMESSISDPALLKAWALNQLKKNAEPKITASITGMELSESTGESLDRLIIGRICRVPLPEYGQTVNERLVELTWRDAIREEENISCTLANEHKTMSGILYEIATGNGGGGGRGGGGKKAAVEHECELGENEEQIEEFENADIWVNRDSVWGVCGSYDVITGPGGTKTLRVKEGTALKLMRNGTEWGLYDEGNLTGGICIDKINDDQTALTIRASKIDLQGYVTAEDLRTVNGKIDNLSSGNTTASSLNADTFWCGTFKKGNYTYTEKTVKDIYGNYVYCLGRS